MDPPLSQHANYMPVGSYIIYAEKINKPASIFIGSSDITKIPYLSFQLGSRTSERPGHAVGADGSTPAGPHFKGHSRLQLACGTRPSPPGQPVRGRVGCGPPDGLVGGAWGAAARGVAAPVGTWRA